MLKIIENYKDLKSNYKIQKYASQVADNIKQLNYDNKPIIVICVGVSKTLGDSYGPLVGTMLDDTPILHKGTLADNVGPNNINDLDLKDYFVVAVDASICPTKEYIGSILFNPVPLKPGIAIKGQNLNHIGDASIVGMMLSKDVFEKDKNSMLTVDLQIVYEMAKATKAILVKTYNIISKE